jgi:protein-tyrosine phosphatase
MDPEYACEVVPRVFFGPAGTTYNSSYKFTHIVNCDTYTSSTSTAGQLKHFLFLPSYDDEEFRILDTHFQTLFDFIQNALVNPKANVFIHCYMGWNRSACLAIAYAWTQQRSKTMKEVIEETKAKVKRDLLTNEDFVKQLFEFELKKLN